MNPITNQRKLYAGIGSRQTPPDILGIMTKLGHLYALDGWILRSGHATGADTCFEYGCIKGTGAKEIFLPWDGYNGAYHSDTDNGYYVINDSVAMQVAAEFHPAWNRCSPGAKKLHARNMQILLGADLQTPVHAIVCWTPGAEITGGTGQALRVAEKYNIPVFNLADPNVRAKVDEYIHTSTL